jgi:uncharacterized membrane protein
VPYVDGLLATDERIVRRERQHWLWPILEALKGVGLLVAAAVGFSLAWVVGGPLGQLLGWLALVVFVVGFVWLFWAVVRWQNEEYVISTRRVIHASGVLNKEASDSSLEMINDAQIVVPLVGRILGFGHLEIMTASEAGIDHLRMLRDPVAFKRAMLDAKHDLEYERGRPRMPAPPIRTDGTAGPASVAAGSPYRAPAAVAAPSAAGGTEGSTAPIAPATAMPAAAAPSAAAGGGSGGGRPADSGEDVTRTLGALADLRDRGAITDEEYEAKKRELLDRL